MTFETLETRLFRDRVQCRSGLIDLVVGIGRHLGGGHLFTLAGERFVGRLSEDLAEVGDPFGDFRKRHGAAGLSVKRATGRDPRQA